MALVSPRASFRARPIVPEDWEYQDVEHRRLLAQTINDVRRGKLNNTGTFLLPGGDLSVVVPNILVEAGSFISVMAIDAAAATRRNDQFYITRQPGVSFTMVTTSTHPQATDANFGYIIFS